MNITVTDYFDMRKIPYKVTGNGFVVLHECVFCDGKNTLGINVSNKKFPIHFFNCFKCVKGHFLQIVQEIDNCSFSKAKAIMGIADISSEETSILNMELAKRIKQAFNAVNEDNIQGEVPRLIKKFDQYEFDFLLTDELNDDAKAYLLKRGFSDKDMHLSGVKVRRANREELVNEVAQRYELNDKEIGTLFELVKKFQNDKTVLAKLKENAPQKYISGFSAICEINRLNGRVVFPVYINKQMTGYVARDYRPNPFVKVLNSFGLDVFSSFWNFDNVKSAKQVVITEGIFSANSCGINRTTAFLGKGVSESLGRYDLLRETAAESVVVYLDVGASTEAKYLCSKLQTYYSDVRIVIVPTVLKIPSPLSKPMDLKIVGVNTDFLSENEIYISYENYFICKKAFKIANAEYQERTKVFHLIKKQVGDTMILHRILQVSRMCSHSPEIQKMVEIISKGDFLDANDFGFEINDKLIKKAHAYDTLAPAIQFLDRTIVRLPK